MRRLHWVAGIGGLLLMLGSWGCTDAPTDVPYEEVQLDLQVVRLDESLYEAAQALKKDSTLSPISLYNSYFKECKPFVVDWMFWGNDSVASDTLVGEAMRGFAGNPQGQILLDTVHKVLGGWDIKGALEAPLKRYKYYFPSTPTPNVCAFVDGFPPTAQAELDQIFISPRYLGIGVHYFMGPSFQYYPSDMPRYIRRRCTPEHLASLVAHKMADVRIPDPELSKNPVLIDFVIHAGVKQYFVDKLLGPEVSDTLKLFYAAEQLDWANLFEGRVYKDLVTDLYSADAALQRRYVDDSPFTSQLNRGSAPRLGAFIGWRIVSAYMDKHPETTLEALVGMRDFQKIFKDAGYRPPKDTE